MKVRVLLASLVLLGIAALVAWAQQDIPKFSSLSQEVVLHATVMDRHKNIVTTLTKDNFKVFEDNVPQNVTVFKREDVPVSIGIVVDNSGSMRDKRLRVAAAALTFVKTSNPQDEVFIVNFNEDYYLDRDFTNNPEDLRDALEKIDSRGGTAFYDALIASLDHLRDHGQKAKKVLLVVTDGVDNSSRSTLEQSVRAATETEAVIYTIGLLSDETGRDLKRAKHALDVVSEASGGAAFYPNDVNEVNAIATKIAHDIRSQYMLAYVPANTADDCHFRALKVLAEARGQDKLTARTRTGYYAGCKAGQDRPSPSPSPATKTTKK